MAHPKHAEVRRRYHACCGYCGVSESDAGGELTVDHFRPVSAGGTDAPANLVYACFRCNQYKGDFFPAADDVEMGWQLLHPVEDDAVAHLREDCETGRLVPLTPTGGFHVTLLQLNRPALVKHRLQQRLNAARARREELLIAGVDRLRQLVEEQDRYIDLLRRLVAEADRGSGA